MNEPIDKSADISVILTCFNEESSVRGLLRSLLTQTRPPDEVIIADGGSTDNTLATISLFQKIDKPPFPVVIIPSTEKINISRGRNRAIEASKNSIIAVTDAGCEIDTRWLENISAPIRERDIDWVGGWYVPKPTTRFERLIAETFVMQLHEVNPETFRPSSRSLAFKKSCWKDIGGYNEQLSLSAEDTLFVDKLRQKGFRFKFAPDAIVYWRPWQSPAHLRRIAFTMGRGDREAGIDTGRYVAIALSVIFPPLLLLGNRRYRNLTIRWKLNLYLTFGYLSGRRMKKVTNEG